MTLLRSKGRFFVLFQWHCSAALRLAQLASGRRRNVSTFGRAGGLIIIISRHHARISELQRESAALQDNAKRATKNILHEFEGPFESAPKPERRSRTCCLFVVRLFRILPPEKVAFIYIFGGGGGGEIALIKGIPSSVLPVHK